MQSIIEIIGSTIIGGMLLLLIITSRTNVNKASNSQVINSTIQSNLTAITEIIDADVKNLGYRINSGQSISTAYSNKITFKIYNDITLNQDSISYLFNPSSKKLFRIFNDSTSQINLGLSNFSICYFDSVGNKATLTSLIKSFKVAITVQDTFQYDGDPITAYWEKTFKPQNL
jgi:hypothetical protein